MSHSPDVTSNTQSMCYSYLSYCTRMSEEARGPICKAIETLVELPNFGKLSAESGSRDPVTPSKFSRKYMHARTIIYCRSICFLPKFLVFIIF